MRLSRLPASVKPRNDVGVSGDGDGVRANEVQALKHGDEQDPASGCRPVVIVVIAVFRVASGLGAASLAALCGEDGGGAG